MTSSRIRVGLSTNTGKRRRTNQDMAFAGGGVYVVCDGMGGGVGGEQASRLAADRFAELSRTPSRTRRDIETALADSQSDVLTLSRELGGMSGTTVTGLVLPSPPAPTTSRASDGTDAGYDRYSTESDLCYVVNIGDSRTYHMRMRLDGVAMAETLSQITKDHSERQEAIDSGTMLPEVANATIPRNIITQCIGSPNGIRPDLFAANVSGRFIVCSDGLYSEVSDDRIGGIAQANPDPQQAADALIAATLEAGAHDNVTVIVVDVLTDIPDDWDAFKLSPGDELDTLGDSTLDGCHTSIHP